MIETTATVQPVLERVQRITLVVGIVGVVLSVIGLIVNPSQFFQSYLAAFIWCFGLSFGGLIYSMIHYLAGGRWGAAIGDVVRSSASLFWLLAIMFLPVAAGAILGFLYTWTNPAVVAADPLISQKTGWLNLPFWLIRAVLYFAFWITISRTLLRWFRDWDATGDPALRVRLRNVSGIGIAVLILLTSFAMFDWLMSLEPDWTSTIYGLLVLVGMAYSGWGLAIFTLTRLRHWWPVSEFSNWQLWRDVGSLLLANLILWAYASFDQLMLIWVGNLNEEIPWYLRRMAGGWEYPGLYLIAIQFGVCFLSLVQRGTRKSAVALGYTAALLVFGRYIETVWLVEPDFPLSPLVNHWLDITMVLGLGGIWLTLFIRQLRERLAVVRPAAIFPEHVVTLAPLEPRMDTEA